MHGSGTLKQQFRGRSYMNDAWESLFAAAVALASAGPIKQRLTAAYTDHLERLERRELPGELREDFDELTSRLSAVKPMRGETAVQATVRKMSDLQAGEHAVRIVGMLGTMTRIQTQLPRQPMLRAVKSDG
jgi:hypothetical protein